MYSADVIVDNIVRTKTIGEIRVIEICNRIRQYCKFGNFCEGFIFAKLRIMRSFVKMKSSQIGEITRPFTDISKSSPYREFLASQICFLTPFAKVKCSRKFRIYNMYQKIEGNFLSCCGSLKPDINLLITLLSSAFCSFVGTIF